jgi:hypothetical protein
MTGKAGEDDFAIYQHLCTELNVQETTGDRGLVKFTRGERGGGVDENVIAVTSCVFIPHFGIYRRKCIYA